MRWLWLHHRQLNINLLEKTLKDNNLLNKPAQIYNVNETGMAYKHRGSGNKAQTTVVARLVRPSHPM